MYISTLDTLEGHPFLLASPLSFPSSPLSFQPSPLSFQPSPLSFRQALSPSIHQAISPSIKPSLLLRAASPSLKPSLSLPGPSRSFQVLPGSLAARQYLRLSSPIFFQLSFPLSTIQHSLPLSLPILPSDLAPSYNGDDSLGSMADAALHHFTPRHHFLWINSVTVGIRAARASMLLHLPLQR